MKNKYIPLNKQNKKAQKEYYKQRRVRVFFNIGTRPHPSMKNPSRAKQKEQVRRIMIKGD